MPRLSDTCPSLSNNTIRTVREGIDSHISSEGREYTGQTKDGIPHGKGRLKFSSEMEYEGDFCEGRVTGYGVLRGTGNFVSRVYEGQFEDGIFQGQGKINVKERDSEFEYKGDWKDGRMSGHGTLAFPNGDRCVGRFARGLPHGKIEYYYSDGRSERGICAWGGRSFGFFNGKPVSEISLQLRFASYEDVRRTFPSCYGPIYCLPQAGDSPLANIQMQDVWKVPAELFPLEIAKKMPVLHRLRQVYYSGSASNPLERGRMSLSKEYCFDDNCEMPPSPAYFRLGRDALTDFEIEEGREYRVRKEHALNRIESKKQLIEKEEQRRLKIAGSDGALRMRITADADLALQNLGNKQRAPSGTEHMNRSDGGFGYLETERESAFNVLYGLYYGTCLQGRPNVFPRELIMEVLKDAEAVLDPMEIEICIAGFKGRDTRPLRSPNVDKYRVASGAQWTGKLQDGQPTGKGELVYPCGARFEGELSNKCEPQGEGLFTGCTGHQFAGSFNRGKFSGKGRLTLNGDIFEGDFKEGVASSGTLVPASFERGLTLSFGGANAREAGVWKSPDDVFSDLEVIASFPGNVCPCCSLRDFNRRPGASDSSPERAKQANLLDWPGRVRAAIAFLKSGLVIPALAGCGAYTLAEIGGASVLAAGLTGVGVGAFGVWFFLTSLANSLSGPRFIEQKPFPLRQRRRRR